MLFMSSTPGKKNKRKGTARGLPRQLNLAKKSTRVQTPPPRLTRSQLQSALKKRSSAGTALPKLVTAAFRKSKERMEVVTESSDDALISFKQALRESEKSLAAVFEALPVGVGVIDSTGTLILANQQMRRYLPTNIIPALDDQRAWRWSARHPDGKPVERTEYPLIRALRGESVLPGLEMLYTENEVSAIWTRVAAVPLRDSEGQVN